MRLENKIRFASGRMLGALAGAAIAVAAGSASAEDTICIGMNGPLSGPSAGWALPGLTGLQLIADRVNEAGGIAADGKTYTVEIKQFDNEYIPSKALQGAKELVLQQGCKLLMGIGGTTADAQLPFLTQAKVFYSPLATADINPNRPYMISGADYFPRGEMIRPAFIRSNVPGAQRYAVVSQEDSTAFVGQAWEVGAAKAIGFDVVYDEFYSAETTDFAPVVTAILASNPDVVSLSLSWPDFIPLLMEQLYLQGFEGTIAANYIEHDTVLQRVPAEWLEKVGALDSYPLFDDPWWGTPSAQRSFFEAWEARFGDGGPDDLDRPMNGIDWLYAPMLQVYLAGVEAAGSTDADAVLKAIRSMSQIQTIQGSATITGEEMFGERNMMSPPVPTNVFNTACNCKRVQALVNWEAWFKKYKDPIIAEVRARGQMWDQRQ